MGEAIKILRAVGKKFSLAFNLTEAPVGWAGIDASGTALPDTSLAVCKKSDSILFGSVGLPDRDPTIPKEQRPERAALLRLRKEFGLFANLRPVKLHKELAHACPLQINRQGDGIDILVDLAGHTAGNRLLTFARKPAPVQVTSWGEQNGTGLTAIDYFLADPVLAPERYRPLLAEKTVDLLNFAAYWTPDLLPEPSSLPALSRGHVTFGSFNRLLKLQEQTVACWSKILKSVPRSRLVLKEPRLAEEHHHHLDEVPAGDDERNVADERARIAASFSVRGHEAQAQEVLADGAAAEAVTEEHGDDEDGQRAPPDQLDALRRRGPGHRVADDRGRENEDNGDRKGVDQERRDPKELRLGVVGH
jgi:hypothetical protein